MTPNLTKMVMCNMESTAIPRPPALPLGQLMPNLGPLPKPPHYNKSSRSRTASFRSKTSSSSQGFRLVENSCHNDETGSVYSIYKQKIDSMFESDSSSAKNSVQAKIEKMFSDVAKDNGIPMNDIGVHSFSVDYLGSVPLQGKVTSLSGLQGPLKDLYFAYKKTTRTKKALTGRLEISNLGLKVLYQGEKGDLEQLNSFPTIAVWSAVKFVIHDNAKTTYAFLPLITDPDNLDKKMLFRTLEDSEKKFITTEAHSPLFAVVMRKIGVHKQLECHGFVCQTSEDAIVIAATLYKSLVAHMKAKERKPRNKNGVTTCMSIASSVYNEKSGNSVPVRPPRKKRSSTSSIISETDIMNISDTQPLLSSNNKPPKKSLKSKRAPKAPESKSEDLDAILPYEEPIRPQEIKPKTFTDKLNTYMSLEQRQLTAEIKQVIEEGGSKCLKKVQSVRKTEDNIIKKENSGDILTKVTIPRSGSFLNTGGLTRYKNKVSRNNEQASGGSPLGFKEIFNELSLQEGLHSLDDILGVIIDPEGMSFNDLKPIYKEFLLKLSVTLTKDELYQRSKSIMRRQKKKLLRRNSSINTKKSHRILVGGKFRRLKHIFQKNLKMRLKQKLKQASAKTDEETPRQTDCKLPESSISTSSYDTRQFRTREELNINKKQSYKKKSGDKSRHRKDRNSTSEESDFFSLKRSKSKSQGFNLLHNQNRNSSSGYVSCSECSYDSDTCTCVSADKCYCSLGTKNLTKRMTKCSGPNCRMEGKCYCNLDNTLNFCECDTDSCTESNKCYCSSAPAFNHLKQKGFTHHNHKKLCKKSSNTKSTKSLEYILNPCESYYEKLKLKSKNSSDIAVEKQMKSKQNGRGSTRTLQSTAISGGCNEALSVKKSAEIAALFADIKLSQTTDITHLTPKNFDVASLISKSSYTKLQQPKYTKPSKPSSNRLDVKTNNMYSAKNGLYTIQSQSDESRRSSLNEGRKISESREYFDLESQYERNIDNVSTNIENSLGYLP
ncbi:uncharacterized protein LOC108903168 [Anoplophora glabripennis]|uniref:uncharacterized protein LOC108903168 n=1 Tax=Anoplophora glabripennis TaxID=217634 RepID=UPI0008751783|nr:uncharacterized protein LOC108903168 [Anoplophora glabripennis]